MAYRKTDSNILNNITDAKFGGILFYLLYSLGDY
jgi:hypothetical protein